MTSMRSTGCLKQRIQMKTWLKLFQIDLFISEDPAHISSLKKVSSDMLFRGYPNAPIHFAGLQIGMVILQMIQRFSIQSCITHLCLARWYKMRVRVQKFSHNSQRPRPKDLRGSSNLEKVQQCESNGQNQTKTWEIKPRTLRWKTLHHLDKDIGFGSTGFQWQWRLA